MVAIRTILLGTPLSGLCRPSAAKCPNNEATDTFRQAEEEAGATNLDYSIGMQIDAGGKVQSVRWNGPAFRAGLSPGSEVVAVDGKPFSTQALLGAVQSSASKPLWLDANINGSKQAIKIDYRGELRYPHLERIAGARDLLSALLGTQ